MQWEELVGHGQQKEWFRRAIQHGRMGTSFLFVGPQGIGKRTFALLLAKSLLCRRTQPVDLAPCGQCEDCAQVEARTHPDLIEVAKPADRATIPIELLIGEREKRMREGLCHDISMRPYGERYKVAILDDADALNVEGANSLLKTLEEPPRHSILILVGTNLQRQLPTIRSRCQAVIFHPLASSDVATLLVRQGIVDTEATAAELSELCDGSLDEARLMANEDVHEFRTTLLEALAAPVLPTIQFVKSCGDTINAVGKDARLRRDRFKLLIRIASAFYRDMALRQCCQSSDACMSQLSKDPLLYASVESATGHWRTGVKGATACWTRCLTAIEQVDRNANQAALLEAWSTDLARFAGC